MKLRFIPGISDSVPGAYMTHCRACVFGQKQMDDRPTVLASSILILTGDVETGRTRFGKILIKLLFFSRPVQTEHLFRNWYSGGDTPQPRALILPIKIAKIG